MLDWRLIRYNHGMTDVPENIEETFARIMTAEFLPKLGKISDIAVAISGGPDSMALTVLLSGWAAKQNPAVKIHALTVDHRLRPESGDEAKAITEWLKPYSNISHKILVWSHDQKPDSRLQEQARTARYNLLAVYMKAHDIQHLFLGHHQDDQAETFLFRLAKGSGLDGLSGMGGFHKFQENLFLCRPLLNFPKEDLVAFCEAQTIPFCKDPSNTADRFARVRLRQSVAALEEEGLSNKRLAITAMRLGRARKALVELSEKSYKDSILRQDTNQTVLKYSHFQNIPEEIGLRVLLLAMNDVVPAETYPPRLERVENLFVDLMKPDAFRKRTLSGIVFERKDTDDKVILTPEH